MKQMPNFKIVILEDDDFYNRLLTRFLKLNLEKLACAKGIVITIHSFTSFLDCKRNLSDDVDLVITDYYLSDGYSAPLIIEKLNHRRINCKVVVMSRLQTIETSIIPILDGAIDFVKKNKKALQKCLFLSESVLSEKFKYQNQ